MRHGSDITRIAESKKRRNMKIRSCVVIAEILQKEGTHRRSFALIVKARGTMNHGSGGLNVIRKKLGMPKMRRIERKEKDLINLSFLSSFP